MLNRTNHILLVSAMHDPERQPHDGRQATGRGGAGDAGPSILFCMLARTNRVPMVLSTTARPRDVAALETLDLRRSVRLMIAAGDADGAREQLLARFPSLLAAVGSRRAAGNARAGGGGVRGRGDEPSGAQTGGCMDVDAPGAGASASAAADERCRMRVDPAGGGAAGGRGGGAADPLLRLGCQQFVERIAAGRVAEAVEFAQAVRN
jgi:hypothetical protein